MQRPKSKLFTFLLVVLVACALWQLYTLSRDVAQLKAEVAMMQASKSLPDRSSTVHSLLSKAYQHMEQANRDIASGKSASAQAEIQRSLQLVQKAMAACGENNGGTTGGIPEAVNEIRDALGRIMQRLQESKKPQGGNPISPPP